MIARIRKLLSDLMEAFWLLPAALVGAGVVLAYLSLHLDRAGTASDWLLDRRWLYSGGAEGARTLLGMIAASTIGVTGTVFSVTIAALSLAAGQMGPRLLRNFTRDRGNQITLGLFLGTFSYALLVLRSVRTIGEGDFVPHLSLSVGVVLALVCVATLVFFVGHIAGRINVDTVIDLVGEDARATVQRATREEPQRTPKVEDLFRDAVPVCDARRGYLQQLDEEGLASWAAERKVAIMMLVRIGHFVFPGAPIALLTRPVGGAEAAIRDATAIGRTRGGPTDLDFAVDQLVEVAIRALSPGINDPNTAISVVDRLGALLCELAPRHLPSGVSERDGSPVLFVPAIGYDELLDSMFGMIRRHTVGNADLLSHMLDVLGSVLGCEREEPRRAVLHRHARLMMDDAERCIANPADLKAVRHSYLTFENRLKGSRVGSLKALAPGR